MTASKKVTAPAGQAPALKKQKPPSPKVAALAMARASATELWHAKEDGPATGYLSHERNGHTEHVELRTTTATQWLGSLTFSSGVVLSRADIESVMDHLEAHAIHSGQRYPVYVRVADLGDVVYLDLANEAWEVVRVTAKGWEIIPGGEAPVRFRRPNGTEALPIPERGGSLSGYSEVVNTSPAGLSLYIAFLVSCLVDRGAQAILNLTGLQGSAKSTATRLGQRSVDPRRAMLRGRPRSEQDFCVAALNCHLLTLDNLSSISSDLSDTMARTATGLAFTTRTLYSNGEEFIISVRRPQILNSITDVVHRPDLGQRTIAVNLLPISKAQRLTDAEVDARFARLHPKLLGALLDAVALGLKRLGTLKHAGGLPRMADFYAFAFAASPLFPGGTALFKLAFEESSRQAIEHALEVSAIGPALLAYLGRSGNYFRGSAGELLLFLGFGPSTPRSAQDPSPRTPNQLANELRRLTPALEATGWRVQTGLKDATGNHRQVVISRATAGGARLIPRREGGAA